MNPKRPLLSKSKFVKGVQCRNLLWWAVHEADAPELQPNPADWDRMNQGTEVGERARDEFPGGLFIDLPYNDFDGRFAATRAALDSAVPAIFEAGFRADGVYVAVDVLERLDDGWGLIEVKASNSAQTKHEADVAVQLHVLRASGLDVKRVQLMHLNPDFRVHGKAPLFVRDDMEDRVEPLMQDIPVLIEEFRDMLAGDFPGQPIGLQCTGCPFIKRCWGDGRDDVRKMYWWGIKPALAALDAGYTSIGDLPGSVRLTKVGSRQRRAVIADTCIVESGLQEELVLLQAPLGFLDFETIVHAIPVWEGIPPWGQVPVQFSYHDLHEDGSVTHTEWLAEVPEDPREALAEAMISACADASRILVYGNFEQQRIGELVSRLPHLATELTGIQDRLFDLCRLIRRNVYHPDFEGSLSLKRVLPVLVPGLAYDDLEIADGSTASGEIKKLMFEADEMSAAGREELRTSLLRYCERDTWALVKLLERLRELAEDPARQV